jgi:lysophospholipase L1-like esterase
MHATSRFWLAIGSCLLMLGSSALAQDAPAKKRVLLIGDSISIGYTPHVKQLLASEVEVFRPTAKNGKAENCSGTTNGVKKIDDWLSRDGGKWDVIHFNFGLHDLKHIDPKTGKNSESTDAPRQAEPAQYEKNLREIAAKIKATGAKVIWCNTTPVPQGKLNPHRFFGDVAEYNAIGQEIAAEEKFAVNDLYGFALPQLDKIQNKADVHFNAAGSKLLAEEVAKSIRTSLQTK